MLCRTYINTVRISKVHYIAIKSIIINCFNSDNNTSLDVAVGPTPVGIKAMYDGRQIRVTCDDEFVDSR